MLTWRFRLLVRLSVCPTLVLIIGQSTLDSSICRDCSFPTPKIVKQLVFPLLRKKKQKSAFFLLHDYSPNITKNRLHGYHSAHVVQWIQITWAPCAVERDVRSSRCSEVQSEPPSGKACPPTKE